MNLVKIVPGTIPALTLVLATLSIEAFRTHPITPGKGIHFLMYMELGIITTMDVYSFAIMCFNVS